mmetsp:Transcript_1379/g.1671  ORF Transcript_1379/g.1671 Transcript_1379/m.1671 type:complete len:523 (+) Transcript_1379:173-1741(+)|eukprot:CAMPEP_0184011896 /NCGR_PEP_ID=MMETSP0954-20121128/4080_1 /TAXON_ID=627963 /ORGANISM="Aplanochytrium sp, Strain PBS07" /LENGTH=522 /DNA_ID=CAMNT_0026291761 /DNA_START=100 /DNA_END=1668 /DNA_ORIENTATION=-
MTENYNEGETNEDKMDEIYPPLTKKKSLKRLKKQRNKSLQRQKDLLNFKATLRSSDTLVASTSSSLLLDPEEKFGTTVSSLTSVSIPLVHKGYNMHKNGYFVAAKKLAKIIIPSSRSVAIAGGMNVVNIGRVQRKVQRAGKKTIKNRHCVLREGTLKFYSTNVTDEVVLDEAPPEELLRGSETIYIQHIRNVELLDKKSRAVKIEYWNKPRQSWMEQKGQQMLNLTLRRRKKSMDKDGTDEGESFEEEFKRKSQRRKKRKSKFLTAKGSGSAGHASLSRRLTKTLSFRRSESVSDEPGSDFDVDNEIDQASEEMDDRDVPDYVVEHITLVAASAAEAKRWMRFIVLSLENQSVVFTAFADILERDQEHIEASEKLRRHAVDLAALACGHKSELAITAQKNLGEFLEKQEHYNEASMWFDLAESKDEEEVELKNNDAFFQLVEFFEMNKVSNADEEARKLFEKYSPSEVALKLHKKYKRVPRDWGYFLRESNKGSILLDVQRELPDLKKSDYFYSVSYSNGEP